MGGGVPEITKNCEKTVIPSVDQSLHLSGQKKANE
jgi:hypothetical protein